MKLTFVMIAILALVSIGNEANAGKWGMAGCGVGSLIFKDKPGKIQLLAATTNQYLVQTSSITSGSSNCKDSPRDVARLFMEINGVALRNDISRGTGETLANLSKIYGCRNSDDVGSVLQKNFSSIYDGSGVSREVPGKIETLLESKTNATCEVLS